MEEPFDLRFGPDGNLYVSGFTNLFTVYSEGIGVLRYSGSTGAPMPGTGLPGAAFSSGASLFGAGGLAFGADDHLYVAGPFNATVQRYDGATGLFLGDLFSANSGGLGEPSFITFTAAVPVPTPEGPLGDATCVDGLDNDGNGLIDAADPGCQPVPIPVSGLRAEASAESQLIARPAVTVGPLTDLDPVAPGASDPSGPGVAAIEALACHVCSGGPFGLGGGHARARAHHATVGVFGVFGDVGTFSSAIVGATESATSRSESSQVLRLVATGPAPGPVPINAIANLHGRLEALVFFRGGLCEGGPGDCPQPVIGDYRAEVQAQINIFTTGKATGFGAGAELGATTGPGVLDGTTSFVATGPWSSSWTRDGGVAEVFHIQSLPGLFTVSVGEHFATELLLITESQARVDGGDASLDRQGGLPEHRPHDHLDVGARGRAHRGGRRRQCGERSPDGRRRTRSARTAGQPRDARWPRQHRP